MLAVKLHKTKRPWLGRGSYLVPVLDWKTGSVQIHNWVRVLDVSRRERRPNTTIRYMTLCRIPSRHPVALFNDWADKILEGVKFIPLRNTDFRIKSDLRRWYGSTDPSFGPGGPYSTLPELILGAPLPPSCVKWTRELRRSTTSLHRLDPEEDLQAYEGRVQRHRPLRWASATCSRRGAFTFESW